MKFAYRDIKFESTIDSRLYKRLDIKPEEVYNGIISELYKNEFTGDCQIVKTKYTFKNVYSDNSVLEIIERGMFAKYVVVCSLGDYTQLQIIDLPVRREYTLAETNQAMAFAMHFAYKAMVERCIDNAAERILNGLASEGSKSAHSLLDDF